MNIISQLRQGYSNKGKQPKKQSYDDLLTPVSEFESAVLPLVISSKSRKSDDKNEEESKEPLMSKQRKALLSILHVLDPKQEGITKKQAEAISRYLVSASHADTEDTREKRLFELEYGSEALAEIESAEDRANFEVDDLEESHDDGEESDESVGSLKSFVVDNEYDDEEEYEESEEEFDEGDDEGDEEGVITTIVTEEDGATEDGATEEIIEDTTFPVRKKKKITIDNV